MEQWSGMDLQDLLETLGSGSPSVLSLALLRPQIGHRPPDQVGPDFLRRGGEDQAESA